MAQGAITVTNVSFSYSATEPVLDNITLSLDGGIFTGILGPNGAGKSTLLRLLSRWHRPDCGEITIGAKSADMMSHRELARNLAVVEQEQRFSSDITRSEERRGGKLCRCRWSP